MAKIYAIVSGKGGVGKTTTAVNLGAGLNHLGKDVIVLDGNITTPNIGIHLGAPVVPITLNHVLRGLANPEEAIYEHDSGMKIIPASLALKDSDKINEKGYLDLTKKLRKITDHVFVDSAAGLGNEAKSVIKCSDDIIIVTNPEMAAVTDALKTIKLAQEMKKPVIGVIITRHKGDKTEMTIPSIEDMLEIPILGIVPEDRAVKKSQVLRNAVIHTHPRSPAARNYMFISKTILGELGEPPITLGVWDRFLRSLGFGDE